MRVLNQVQSWFEQICLQYKPYVSWPEHQLYRLNLALAEGFTNAVRHAHDGLPPETPIEIRLTVAEDQIEICIWDQGKPFDPESLEEPKPGTLREGGYGWFLLRRLADHVGYERHGTRNCLRIVKKTFA